MTIVQDSARRPGQSSELLESGATLPDVPVSHKASVSFQLSQVANLTISREGPNFRLGYYRQFDVEDDSSMEDQALVDSATLQKGLKMLPINGAVRIPLIQAEISDKPGYLEFRLAGSDIELIIYGTEHSYANGVKNGFLGHANAFLKNLTPQKFLELLPE